MSSLVKCWWFQYLAVPLLVTIVTMLLTYTIHYHNFYIIYHVVLDYWLRCDYHVCCCWSCHCFAWTTRLLAASICYIGVVGRIERCPRQDPLCSPNCTRVRRAGTSGWTILKAWPTCVVGTPRKSSSSYVYDSVVGLEPLLHACLRPPETTTNVQKKPSRTGLSQSARRRSTRLAYRRDWRRKTKLGWNLKRNWHY